MENLITKSINYGKPVGKKVIKKYTLQKEEEEEEVILLYGKIVLSMLDVSFSF